MPDRRAPTPQQQQAIDARGVSVVLSSGAGCGKTSVLTERYLKHLDDGDEVGQVVAITFTDRAAREMRDRIRSGIVERLQHASDESASRWNTHLRDLESAPISTIHAFCGAILRQFAAAAGLDPRFEILEEVLARNLRADTLRQCLQELLVKQSPAGEDLRDLVVQYGWPATLEAVRQLVSEANPVAWTAWLGSSPERIEADWLAKAQTPILGEWVDYLVAADPTIGYCLNLLRVTPCRGEKMSANVARLLDEVPLLASAPDLGAAVDALKECAKVGGERGKAWDDDATYQRIKSAFDDFRIALRERFAPFRGQTKELRPAIQNGQRFVRVALEAVDAYQSRKWSAGALDFQDLLVSARDLLRDRREVREALRQRFRHILLDEMQDTDPVQMELIRSLCSERDVAAGKLFAVGDHKQSIYRFRGAEVRLFRELRQMVPTGGRLELTGNFRSQQPILDFVNALCSRRIPGYEPLEAKRTVTSEQSCVEFLWSFPAATEERSEKETARTIRTREASAIARRIKDLVAAGERRIFDPASLSARPVQLQDIVLLFRTMSNVAIYEEALRRQGIDYYLVGGRAFFAQQEIFDLLNLLRALENPDDSLSLAGALRSPFTCLSDDALFWLAAEGHSAIWEGMHSDAVLKALTRDDREALLRARRNFERWRGLKDRLPIARLIGEIFADSGYDAAMQFEILGDRKLANLWKLQDLARTFDRSGMFGLADFVQRLGEMVRDAPREEQAATLPENANVVKLMSIHQAKGLEFPVVFVPDLTWAPRGSHNPSARWHRDFGCLARVPPDEEDDPPFSDFGWKLGTIADTIDDWQEQLRILYVACTRAEDMLVLSAGFDEPFPPGAPDKPLPIPGSNAWIMALSERFNMSSGVCLADDLTPGRQPKARVQIVQGAEPVPELSDLSPELEARSSRGGLAREPEFPLPEPRHEPLVYVSPWESDTVASVQQLFRRTFDAWDLAEKGWQPLLETNSAEMDFEDREQTIETARRWLEALDGSDVARDFRAASERFSHLEFLSGTGESRGSHCGLIDLLWRDAKGTWHLAAITSLGQKDPKLKESIASQAAALRAQLGKATLVATTYDPASGKSSVCNLPESL